MKRVGVIALHYGKEYLGWAVEALACAVDEIHIFYTPTPSYGHVESGAKCPDTEAELRKAAQRFMTTPSLYPLIWHHCDGFTSESMHRNHMLEVARGRGAQTMVVVDADEIWDPGSLRHAIDAVEAANCAGRWLARFHNFWRSFYWTVKDSFTPVRIVDLRHSLTKDAYLTEAMQPLPVYHFGYAQSLATMRYKFSCHGHKAEFRPGWFEKTFAPWTPAGPHADLHPCVNNLWTATPTDPATNAIVDAILIGHPYRGVARIE